MTLKGCYRSDEIRLYCIALPPDLAGLRDSQYGLEGEGRCQARAYLAGAMQDEELPLHLAFQTCVAVCRLLI